MDKVPPKENRHAVGKGTLKKDSQTRRYPLRNRSPEPLRLPNQVLNDSLARPLAEDEVARQDGRYVSQRRPPASSPRDSDEQNDSLRDLLREIPMQENPQGGGAVAAAAATSAAAATAAQPTAREEHGVTAQAIADQMARLQRLEELCEGLRNTQININTERIRLSERLEVQEGRTEELELRQTETDQALERLERSHADVNRQVEINFIISMP